MQQLGIINLFYFIRYRDPRQHIRFRFKVDQSQKRQVIRVLTDNLENGSIHIHKYEPELNRYGGQYLMEIIESQFCFSTKTCIEIMQCNADVWSHDLALAKALQMHLGLGYAFGLKQNEVQQLFELILNDWFRFLIPNKVEDNVKSAEFEILGRFEKLYQRTEELDVIIRNQWAALVSTNELEGLWLNDWVNCMKMTFSLISEKTHLNDIRISKDFLFKEYRPTGRNSKEFFSLCDSLIHMTNNRLGISIEDEAYLAFIISRSLYAK